MTGSWTSVLTTAALINVMFIGIGYALRSHGPLVMVGAVSYIVILVAMALCVKVLAQEGYNFKYPATLTLVHYSCLWFTTALYFIVIKEPRKCFPSSVGAPVVYLRKFGLIALTLPLSIAFNNGSIMYLGAGLASLVGTLSGLCTALLSCFAGQTLTCMSWLGVAIAGLGALVIGIFEVRHIQLQSSESARNVVWGFTLALTALAMRSIRIVLQEFLTRPGRYQRNTNVNRPPDDPLSSMHLLCAQSPLVVLVSGGCAIMNDSPGDVWEALTARAASMILASSVIATCLNMTGAYLLTTIGATSMQLIGKLSCISTTAISMLFFGENLPPMVIAGGAYTLLGVCVFEYGQRSVKKKTTIQPHPRSSMLNV